MCPVGEGEAVLVKQVRQLLLLSPPTYWQDLVYLKQFSQTRAYASNLRHPTVVWTTKESEEYERHRTTPRQTQ